jgi:ABC-2 type transport system ATP-binding protein
MIELQGVTKRYGDKAVVRDVSFSVSRGEILGFLGPNGAGKTTTLRMIAGYTTASEGRVLVAGHDMAEDNVAATRQIGYVPEHPPLYGALDVRAFLRFVAKAKGVPRAAARAEIERAVEACRLQDAFRTEIFKLSKGYRQRVALAQALLGAPKVLLLDEPTIGLDPQQIQDVRGVIREFGGRRTVLLSTHILPEVTLLCRRVAILHHGRLLAIDSPEGLARAVEESYRVELAVEAAEPELRDALLAVDGVRAVHVRPDRDRLGLLQVTCLTDRADTVEARIARALAARFDLHRLHRLEPSLESVFLRYIEAPREVAQ